MTQWDSNGAPTDDSKEETGSLFDELGSVSTMSFPAVPNADSDDSNAPSFESGQVMRAEERRKKHHRRTVIFTVFISLIALALIGGGIYYAYQFMRADSNVSSEYTQALKKASNQQEELSDALADAKEPLATLTSALPTSSDIQDFTKTWNKGQSLVDNPPEYFSKPPQKQEDTGTAVTALQEYTTSMSHVSKRLRTQLSSAGADDAQSLYASSHTALSSSVTQAQLILSNYKSQNKKYHLDGDATTSDSDSDPDSDSESSTGFDTALVDTVNTQLDEAQTLLKTEASGTPAEVARTAVEMSQKSDDLKTAYDALQDGVNDAVAKAKTKTNSSDYEVKDGLLPKALIGTWKTSEGTSLTFASTSLQGHSATATRVSTKGIQAPDSATLVEAAWSLTAGGKSGGIEDTSVVLYSKDGSEYLIVKTESQEWKLTR